MLFESVIEVGQVPAVIAVARFCGWLPANHSAWVLVEPLGIACPSVRGVAPPAQVPAVELTIAVNTVGRYGNTIVSPTVGAVSPGATQITALAAVTFATPL